MSNEKTTLVIQSFGREIEYKRAILTILSYFTHTSFPLNQTKVLLFTDQPSYFDCYLLGLPVQYIMLDSKKIKQMRGTIDFLHRMKIAVVEEAFKLMRGGNMLYTDSDTFFIDDPTALVCQVTPNKSFMHLWEYSFDSMRELPLPMGQTFHAFLKLIENHLFHLADGSTLRIAADLASWNAGVMMLHSSHADLIPDVYALTDQFYPPTKNHASEQYAFSILLQNSTEVNPCDSVIYHYWYRVKKQIVDLFLAERLTNQWSELPLHDKLFTVKKWTQMLPGYFDSHILTLRDNAVQAFNENKFRAGYNFSVKAIQKDPFDLEFVKHILYHTKRRLIKR